MQNKEHPRSFLVTIFAMLGNGHSMAAMSWSEFNFVLMPSKLGGVNVFAAVDIAIGIKVSDPKFEYRVLRKIEIPTIFHQYCIHKNNEEFFCPPRFDCMQMGWFINHSHEPNVALVKDPGSIKKSLGLELAAVSLITCKKISAGDEIVLDYNTLLEPEHLREGYYINCTVMSTAA